MYPRLRHGCLSLCVYVGFFGFFFTWTVTSSTMPHIPRQAAITYGGGVDVRFVVR